MKIDWKRKLTSRKFWMALASFVSMLVIYFTHSEAEGTSIASLIMAGGAVIAYIIGEGLADNGNIIFPVVEPVDDSVIDEEDMDAEETAPEETTEEASEEAVEEKGSEEAGDQ